MPKYTVVKAFRDFEDKLPNGEFHTYYEGDEYPRAEQVNEERAALLSSEKNKRGEILIKEVKEEVPEKEEALENPTEEAPKKVAETKAKKAEDEKAKKEAAK